MKVTLEIDREPREVEVDLVGRTATVGGRTFPIQVLSNGPARIELEIAGERVVVEGWFTGVRSPDEPVAVAGELHRVHAEVGLGSVGPLASATPPLAAAGPGLPLPPPAAAGGGTLVVPPMPGKVVELRVAEGDRVSVGQVLLVLEAMKMRNEVASPSAGRVTQLRVQAGSNVRAREAMLVIVPE
jgi:pyruvate dehydrogenase E2 component (dihydrolipoamide acetyltransferase)